jgi:hypothetical protein
MEHVESIGKMGYKIVEPGIRWHLCVSPTLVLARSSNAAALARIRLANAAAPLPYGSGKT